MKTNIFKLNLKQIKYLKKSFELLKFNSDFELVYELQVPISGIVLISGELSLIQKNRVDSAILPGNLLGVSAILNNESVKYGCKIISNSEIILLHRSDIFAALANEDSILYEIIKMSASRP